VLALVFFGLIGGEIMAILGGLIGASQRVCFALFTALPKFYMLSSVIGRLTFRELIQQPETSIDARRIVAPKARAFFSA
jgi:predicted lipid-binding transport protein (Tim44 family)